MNPSTHQSASIDDGRVVPPHGSGPVTVAPRPKRYWLADPDETEGRRLFRASAEAQVRRDMAKARYKVTLLERKS